MKAKHLKKQGPGTTMKNCRLLLPLIINNFNFSDNLEKNLVTFWIDELNADDGIKNC